VNILGINDLRELDLRDALSRSDLSLIGRPFRLDRTLAPEPERLSGLLSAPETAGLVERGLVTPPGGERSPETLSGGLATLPTTLMAAWREVEEEEFRSELEPTEPERLAEGFSLIASSEPDRRDVA